MKMQNQRRSRLVTWLTCLSLLITMAGGIMVSDQAEAAPTKRVKKGNKVSSDLSEKAHGPRKDETVKVILQLDAPMSGELKALLNRNDVHVNASFKNFSAHAI